MAKFDPIMKQHVGRVESGAGSHTHYLGKRIQNELIDSISTKILEKNIGRDQDVKVFLHHFRLHP